LTLDELEGQCNIVFLNANWAGLFREKQLFVELHTVL